MGRFSRVAIGFAAACLVAAYTKLLFAITPAELAGLPSDVMLNRLGDIASWGWKFAVLFGLFSLPFAIIALAIAEWRHFRAWTYYTVIALAISMVGYLAQYSSEPPGAPTVINRYALAAYIASGLLAGLSYWLFAGHVAGAGWSVSRGEGSRPAPVPDASVPPKTKDTPIAATSVPVTGTKKS